MDIFFGSEMLASTIRLSVPLILACLAGLWSERSGIVDIGLEGKMLAGAFAAAAAAHVFGSAWTGLLFALIVSVALALIHGYASINQRGNQVVSGVAINMLAAGLALVLGNTWFGEGGRTPALQPDERFLPLKFPGRGCAARHAGARLALQHPLRPFATDLCGLPAGAADRLGAGPHPLWLEVARGGRKSPRRRYGRHFGGGTALPGGDHRRPPVRPRRRLSLDLARRRLHQGHVGGPRFHGAGGADLRQLAGLAGARRLPAVRLPERRRQPAAGRRCCGVRNSRCNSSTCCPMC